MTFPLGSSTAEHPVDNRKTVERHHAEGLLNPDSAIQRETAAKKPETQAARRLRDCI